MASGAIVAMWLEPSIVSNWRVVIGSSWALILHLCACIHVFGARLRNTEPQELAFPDETSTKGGGGSYDGVEPIVHTELQPIASQLKTVTLEKNLFTEAYRLGEGRPFGGSAAARSRLEGTGKLFFRLVKMWLSESLDLCFAFLPLTPKRTWKKKRDPKE